MPGSGNKGTVRTFVTACSVRSGDVCQRYVSGLHRQALLTLGDSASAHGIAQAGNLIGHRCRNSRGTGER